MWLISGFIWHFLNFSTHERKHYLLHSLFFKTLALSYWPTSGTQSVKWNKKVKALWKKRVHFVGQSYNSKKLTVKGIHLFTLLCWSLLVVVLFSENISEACSVENSSGVAFTIGRVVPGTIESSGTFTIAAGVVGSSGHHNSCETINRSLLQNRCVNMNHCHPNKYIQ